MHNPLAWIGLAGVDDEDTDGRSDAEAPARRDGRDRDARRAAYYFETADAAPVLHRLAYFLDLLILVAFLAEAVWMCHVSKQPGRYLADNWLNGLVILGSLASVLGANTGWVALVRVMRVTIAGLVMVRTFAGFRFLFTRRGAPILVGAAFLILLAAGGVLYWVEPSIDNYWDGLWLAFVTGMTIGYGDVIPTTGTARVVAAGVGLIGVALVTLFTASVVSFFVGGDESQSRRELQSDISSCARSSRSCAKTWPRYAPSSRVTMRAPGGCRLLRQDVTREPQPRCRCSGRGDFRFQTLRFHLTLRP
jgi:voltage-gated potassium channel